MHNATKAGLGLVGAGAACLGWASLVERNWYAVRRATVPVLPAGADPVTVLHLSDLHLVPRQERRIQWVRELACLAPDFVINTGDNCSDLNAVPAVLHAMEPLLDRPGAFVFGSNDYWAPMFKNPAKYFKTSHRKGADMGVPELPWRELRAGLVGGGWTDLNNRRARISLGGIRTQLLGLDDPHLGYDDLDTLAEPATDAELTLGVVHAPYLRALDALTAAGADLVLAGHTHGGQLAVPLYGALVTNCDLGTDRAKGLSRWWPGADNAPSAAAPDGAGWLNVSAGLGHNKYTPVRFACRPEASLLTLVAR
ncbi:metallophosphoesterase [Calidifontibacter sp. DB0510]|uniref:Metallophosphoesterase n=1 Tax=Metallococcus carri TaxID=1656884 RepID=A0A967EHQ8_9MICO|nr:metallophosphoesterase [Metallococcus carri]NHN56823.1 metallophosphoesterase [Metallococcus carri]NOP37800.1 metallophosphoesterase [Calidifontibacter sp. DB2511S]